MTNPTYFTVIADFKSVVVDLASDVDPDPQLGPVTAKVTFTPVLNNGDVILATNASPRPTVFVPAPIVARIDTDGRLKLRVAPDGDRDDYANLAAFPATGNIAKVYFAIDTQTFYRWIPGSSQYVADYSYAQVRMLADTGLLELDSPLYYKVTFSDVVYNGGPGYINSFTFQAPTSDTELNLVEVLRQPGQPAVGITKIAPGAVRAENGNLIFSFNGVDIPEPVPYADVNVTMSATDINDSTPTGRALVTADDAAAARATLGAASVLVIDPTQAPYNVKMDRYTTTSASMSSSSNPTQLTVGGYTFTSADIGKVVKIVGAAAGGANLKTTITGVASGNAVLASPCLTTVSGAFAMFGTDNAAALSSLFDDLSFTGRARKLSRTVIFPQGVAMFSGTLSFPTLGTIKGVAENWVNYDIMYAKFGGAENTSGTAFYQMWDQNVDCARVRHSGYAWNGSLNGFAIIQDWENTAGNGLNFTASDNTGIKVIDGGTINRVAVMGCANAGFNFAGGAITATFRDLYAYCNGYVDRKIFTANTTSGSATLTSVSSFTGLAVGNIVSGPGIPVDSVISTLNSGASTLTINQNATATATGVSVQRAGSPGIRFKVSLAESVHFDFPSGDQNGGGLLRLVGPGGSTYGGAITITNLKNEFGENTYWNGYHGPGGSGRPTDVPQGANAIVLDNCPRSSINIRGLMNWGTTTSGVASYSPNNTFGRDLGAAILSLNTGTAPVVAWEGLTIQLPSGATQTAYAYRDSLSPSSAIIATAAGRGTNTPLTLTNPKINTIVDATNNGTVTQFYGVSSAANYLVISNSETANAPQISAAGSDSNVNILVTPKGTGDVQIYAGAGITPEVSAIGADTNVSLNLKSKNAGTVNINGSAALYSGGPLGTPASGTLTNCTFPTLNQNTSGTASNVTGTVAVANGGTGATTLTGLIKGTGTTAMTAATAGTDYLAPTDIENLGTLTTGESTRPRGLSTAGVSTGSGSLRLTYFTAAKTETINSIRTVCTTAGTSSTLQRIGIYSIDGSGNLTLVASTASDTSLWIAASAYTKALSASFSKVRGTRYAVGILYVGGGTAPSLSGLLPTNATEAGQPPRLSGFLTSQTDLPSSITSASILDTSNNHYAVLVP